MSLDGSACGRPRVVSSGKRCGGHLIQEGAETPDALASEHSVIFIQPAFETYGPINSEGTVFLNQFGRCLDRVCMHRRHVTNLILVPMLVIDKFSASMPYVSVTAFASNHLADFDC